MVDDYLIECEVMDDGGNLVVFDLPPIIERLQKLKEIEIANCRSIPKELDNLPLLEKLEFSECEPELFNQNMPEGIQLAGLKSITLQSCDF